jgi:hypothetical protein
MNKNILFALILTMLSTNIFGQTIKRIDGSKIKADDLNSKIENLMKTANVSGVAGLPTCRIKFRFGKIR